MKKAREVIERIYQKKYSETQPGCFYPEPYPEWVLDAMQAYAIECCKIQRVICSENAETETDTSTSYVYTSVNKNSIIGASLPKFLKETK